MNGPTVTSCDLADPNRNRTKTRKTKISVRVEREMDGPTVKSCDPADPNTKSHEIARNRAKPKYRFGFLAKKEGWTDQLLNPATSYHHRSRRSRNSHHRSHYLIFRSNARRTSKDWRFNRCYTMFDNRRW